MVATRRYSGDGDRKTGNINQHHRKRRRGLEYFEKEIHKRKIKPTHLLPLWDIMGVALGFGTALLGKKAAMLCTASVEEVIEDHYQNQLKKIGNDEMELKAKIEKFQKHFLI